MSGSGATPANILLLVLDTARADAFEPYGAGAGATPTIADLARRGGAHPAAFSTASWTVPAHGSLLSGLLPRSAGLEHEGGQTPEGFAAALHSLRPRLLPSVLGHAGYSTLGLSANLWVSPHSGFDTGFDTFEYFVSRRSKELHPATWRGKVEWYVQALRAKADDGAGAIERELDQWLRDRPHRPFFWFVNLVECHSPFLPPRPFNPLSPLDRVRAAREASRHLTFDEIWRCSVGGYDVPDGAIERMRRLYAASVTQMDAWLARVLTLLDAAGVLGDTQIVVTSDHGENLGEDHLLGHAFSLDDRLLRIPFVTAGPAAPPAAPVFTLAGVPAWLATVAGLDEHPWNEPQTGDVAVAQFDAPGVGNEERCLRALADWGLGEDAMRRMCTSFTAATDGCHKLVRRRGREELFDLAADPLEQRPLAVDAYVEARLGPALPRLRAALDRAAAEERPRVAIPLEGSPDEVEREAIEAQMRLLGYL